MLGSPFPLTEEKLFGWGFKKWALFFGFQVFMFGLGTGFAITYTIETGKNPLGLVSSYGAPTSFNVRIYPNGTDIINVGRSHATVTGTALFNLQPGCYHIDLLVNYLAKQITVNADKIDPSLC